MKKLLLFFMAFSLSFLAKAQSSDIAIAKKLVAQNSKTLGLSADDLQHYIVSNAYNADGTQYVYLLQEYKGLPVFNQMLVLAFKNGEVISNAGAFIPEMAKATKGNNATPALSAASAVAFAFHEAKVAVPAFLKTPFVTDNGRKNDFGAVSGVTENVKAELMWIPVENGKTSDVKLAWQVQVVPTGTADYWLMQVDAKDGRIIKKINLTVYDSWEKKGTAGILRARNTAAKAVGSEWTSPFGSTAAGFSPQIVGTANYLVIPFPAESPAHAGGTAAVRTNPWTAAVGNASTLGWQSDGTTDYTITRGNNVWATEDRSATNLNTGAPATSSTTPDPLNFNFPPNYNIDPTTPAMQQFCITNLFYWNNLMHDMSYQYGFIETAANFQKNNLGRGGNQGDDVIALAQSGAGTNNANFSTPADGGRGRMRMYLFDAVTTTKVHVNAPASIVGDYAAIEGNFSTANQLANVGPVTAPAVYWNDAALTHEACTVGNTPTNSVSGKIALIDRGNCNFTEKILNAQNAGAVGVIMLQITGGTNAPNPIIMGGADNTITIPAVMVSISDAATFVGQVSNGLNVTLSSTAGQLLDGDLDAGVMCHEYTHGISNRMTGGGTGTCLSNAEEGGEGWSDYFGLMMTTNWATATINDGPIPRAVGTYVFGQNPTSGSGIRNYPYTTNIAVNPLTYASLGVAPINVEVHNIGEVWCMAIWEMTWAIIQQQGAINTNLYNYSATNTGGNTIALKLVLEGFKLQPCSPGFIDGRDAILKADRNIYAGRHACAIWTAFAKRGMGFPALQGSSNSASDQTASTAMPPAPTVATQPVDVSVASGANATFTASAGTNVNLIYRWQVSTNGGTTWNDVVPDVITPALTLTGVTAAMNGYKYRAVVSIGCLTTTTSVATLTVTGATVPTVTLTSATGTNAQTVCVNTAITPITYSVTGGATGATVTGLPTGVTGVYNAGVVTISGTPTTTTGSPFTYTVTTTGGTGTASATGTITVNANTTLTLTSAAATTNQTVTLTSAITPIIYSSANGVTGITVTGLPAGVTGVYSGGTNGTFTISGTPTVTGTFPYTVTTVGGCGTQTATGTITVASGPAIALSSAAGTNAQTVCVNTAITNITYTTSGGVTGATVAGLPAGVTFAYSGGTNGAVTISGTPTATGTSTYTVTTSGGSAVVTATGTITVNGASTITLSSAAGTNAQTVCANTAITNITYATTNGVTGVTATGLPAGVTGTFAGSTFTISGTPTVAGSYSYTVTTAGGCGVVTANGTVTVNPGTAITLTSAAGTNNQTKCINTAITPITYSTSGGVTAVTVSGLPAGVTGVYSGGTNGTFMISGTPTAAGTSNYTVTTTGGCASVTATGSIIVAPNATLTLTSAAGTAAQTVCVNTAIANIVYTAGTGVTGATATGLPAGVTGTFAGSTFTISGTPTAAGTFSYTVTTAVGCGTATATGTITVNAAATITLTSAASTANQTVCGGTPIVNIVYQTANGATGATATGLPAGVAGTFAGGVFTLSGTPTVSGLFNYTVTTTGGCGAATLTGTITAGAAPSITTQPTSITSCSTTATFSVTATGPGLTYQWQVSTDGGTTYTNIAGATSSTLTLNNLTTAQANNRYRVVVTGSCGSVTSSVVTAQVGTPPVVLLVAAPSTAYNPSAAGGGLFATVSPVGNYVYQWKRNGVILPTVLGPSITNTNGILYDFGAYQVSVIDVATGCTGVSNVVTIVDDLSLRNHLFISPNPATDFINVSYYSSTVAAQARTLELYDGKGARVMIKDYSTTGIYGNMRVDISKFVGGTYMIVLRDASGKKIASDRFVKH